MKGFWKWFKSSTKVKRWMLLILVGIVATCYGMSSVLVEKELAFQELGKLSLIFILGFVCIILGMVFLQRRTLELLVQDSDTRDIQKKAEVKSLIFNKKVYNQGPKVVVIGGGTGLNAVLKGLKHYTDNITAIVTVSDYGEVASDSRKILETKPVQDIIDSFIALSGNEEVMGEVLKHKFKKGKLKNLALGDIYLLAMNEVMGDFAQSVEQAKNVLGITGKVLPVTLDEIEICAELEDGTVIEKRSHIPEMVSDKVSKIHRIYIRPTNCRPAPGVLEAISEADAIVIGPGSLYTNVIPNLLVKGVSKAIRESKGFKIYISNIMTEPGQTDNYMLSDHIRAIEEHAGKGIMDYCIYDTQEIVPEFIRKYNLEGQDMIEIDTAKAKTFGVKLMQRKLATIEDEKIRHDSDGIATAIISLICDDLKFRDQQNDAQFMLLNHRIKDTKKTLKKKQQNNRIRPSKDKNKRKNKSKFLSKYNERIQSIQESDNKGKPATKELDRMIQRFEMAKNQYTTATQKSKTTSNTKIASTAKATANRKKTTTTRPTKSKQKELVEK